jgi:hypothetical protein
MEQLTFQPPTIPGLVALDEGQLGQIAYHVRWSAALCAQGASASAAHHALVAAALLDVVGGESLQAARSALDLPEVTKASSVVENAQRSAAMELAHQFVSHFTSDGRHDLADLYSEARLRIGQMH